MILTFQLVHRAKGNNPSVTVVRSNYTVVLGLIKRHRKTPGGNPPYMAYHGDGLSAVHLGDFYDAKQQAEPLSKAVRAGGKKAAIRAIVESWRNIGIVKSSMREVPIVIEGDEFFVRHPTSGPYQSVSGPFKLTDRRFILPLR